MSQPDGQQPDAGEQAGEDRPERPGGHDQPVEGGREEMDEQLAPQEGDEASG